VLRGAVKGNGNYLERLLGALRLGGDAAHMSAAFDVAQRLVSRRVLRHYAGFATSQLHAFDDKPTAKRALYVLRTAATGRCLLATGALVTDVGALADFVPVAIGELLAIKLRGEREPLAAEHAAGWRARLVDAIAQLERAYPTSVLPPEPSPDAIAAADAWLRDVRRASW
jgi:hypothetical protein